MCIIYSLVYVFCLCSYNMTLNSMYGSLLKVNEFMYTYSIFIKPLNNAYVYDNTSDEAFAYVC